MVAEFGQITLILALIIAGAQSVLPMVGAHKNDPRLMAFADWAALAQFILIAASFCALTYIFIRSDFSVELAALNSHTNKPLLYKISGVWGNHEGSMLFWVLILSVYGACVPVFGKALPISLRSRALAVQGMIGAGFLVFILFTSNPFLRLNPVPPNGQGLNPLLQDPGLAFHPPFLYLGYVGFSMAFSFSVAALIEGRVDAVWARWLRPWVLIAWCFLTIGITMGSIWAYYELGWGGWWGWDPVENVSFLPWLIGTALLHSILVLGKRHTMANWTVLLAITTFSLSLVGTFVVRSGVLTSVHSFAVDPARGVYILILLGMSTGGALGLYALRSHTLRGSSGFELLSKEGGLVLNNLLLVVATATVFLGTFYPLLVEVFSKNKISVGAPYFDITFAPVMVVLIMFMGIGPMVKWRVDSFANIRPHLLKSGFVISLVALGVYLFGKSVLGALTMGLAAHLFYTTLMVFGRKIGFGKSGAWQRTKAQPANVYGFLFGHLGMAIAMAGIVSMSVWLEKDVKILKLGESMTVGGYEFTLITMQPGEVENYQFLQGSVLVSKNEKPLATLRSARRFYPVREMVTTEAGIQVRPMRNLYVGIGDGDAQQGWVVRAYIHPMVCWIWLGALMMALAGFVSLFDYRSHARRKS